MPNFGQDDSNEEMLKSASREAIAAIVTLANMLCSIRSVQSVGSLGILIFGLVMVLLNIAVNVRTKISDSWSRFWVIIGIGDDKTQKTEYWKEINEYIEEIRQKEKELMTPYQEKRSNIRKRNMGYTNVMRVCMALSIVAASVLLALQYSIIMLAHVEAIMKVCTGKGVMGGIITNYFGETAKEKIKKMLEVAVGPYAQFMFIMVETTGSAIMQYDALRVKEKGYLKRLGKANKNAILLFLIRVFLLCVSAITHNLNVMLWLDMLLNLLISIVRMEVVNKNILSMWVGEKAAEYTGVSLVHSVKHKGQKKLEKIITAVGYTFLAVFLILVVYFTFSTYFAQGQTLIENAAMPLDGLKV